MGSCDCTGLPISRLWEQIAFLSAPRLCMTFPADFKSGRKIIQVGGCRVSHPSLTDIPTCVDPCMWCACLHVRSASGTWPPPHWAGFQQRRCVMRNGIKLNIVMIYNRMWCDRTLLICPLAHCCAPSHCLSPLHHYPPCPHSCLHSCLHLCLPPGAAHACGRCATAAALERPGPGRQ